MLPPIEKQEGRPHPSVGSHVSHKNSAVLPKIVSGRSNNSSSKLSSISTAGPIHRKSLAAAKHSYNPYAGQNEPL
jgi:hypothetical protein